MPKTKNGDVRAVEEGAGPAPRGTPGRSTRTGRMAPGRTVQGSPLAAEYMPQGEPAGRAADDPYGMHLVGSGAAGSDADRPGPASEQHQVEAELAWLIEHADWSKLRPRAVEVAARAPRQRAQARRDHLEPDLTGVGSVLAVDQLAAAVKAMQARWGELSADARKAACKSVADQVLVQAQLPGLTGINAIEGKLHPASFFFPEWKINLRAELLTVGALPDADAASLAEALGHELRHAEQFFLMARVLAGRGMKAGAIAAQLHGLYGPVAAKAVALGARGLTAAQQDLVGRLEPAFTTDWAINNRFDGDTGYKEMAVARAAAQASLDGLRADPPTVSVVAAQAACRDVREHIEDVLLKYVIYRQLPIEEDAHEAGAGAELAFEAQP